MVKVLKQTFVAITSLLIFYRGSRLLIVCFFYCSHLFKSLTTGILRAGLLRLAFSYILMAPQIDMIHPLLLSIFSLIGDEYVHFAHFVSISLYLLNTLHSPKRRFVLYSVVLFYFIHRQIFMSYEKTVIAVTSENSIFITCLFLFNYVCSNASHTICYLSRYLFLSQSRSLS